MSRSALVVLLLGLSATQVAAKDVGVSELRAIANSDGRLEVYGTGPDRTLYHRYEQTPGGQWSLWGVHRAPANIDTQVLRAPAPDGRLYVATLDNGVLALRRQQSANAGFDPQEARTGHDLRSIALATNQDGGVGIVAIGGTGQLFYMAQAQPGSAQWSDWSLAGGDHLRTNPLPAGGTLENFIRRPRVLALARDGEGALNAFAIGAGGAVWVGRQSSPGAQSWTWASLEGTDLEEISAIANKRGAITLLALGADHALYARQQTNAGEWGAWMLLSRGPVADFTADTTPGGLIEAIVALPDALVSRWQIGRRRVGTQFIDADPTWPDAATATIENPDGATTPILGVSATTNDTGRSGLFVSDVKGEVFLLVRPEDASAKDWPIGSWTWLGGPTIEGEAPDVLVQGGACLADSQRDAAISGLIDGLRQEAGNSVLLREIRNVSAYSVCTPVGGGMRETLGIWLGRQPSVEFLTDGADLLATPDQTPFLAALRFTRAGIDRIIDSVWSKQLKRFDSDHKPDRDGEIELRELHRAFLAPDTLELEVDGNLWQGASGSKFSLPFSAYADAKIDVAGGAVACDEQVRVDGPAEELGTAAQFVIPFNFGLGVYPWLVAEQDKAEGRTRSILGEQLCLLTDAIPQQVLIAQKSAAGVPQKIVFAFDGRLVDDSGITLLTRHDLNPVDRTPSILWSTVYGSAQRTDGNHVRVQFHAIAQDLRAPSASWRANRSGTAIEDAGGVYPGELVAGTFVVPPGSSLQGLSLGTMTVEATDMDGQAVSYSHEIVLDDFATARIPPAKSGRPNRPEPIHR